MLNKFPLCFRDDLMAAIRAMEEFEVIYAKIRPVLENVRNTLFDITRLRVDASDKSDAVKQLQVL